MKIGVDIDGTMADFYNNIMEKGKAFIENENIKDYNIRCDVIEERKMFNWGEKNDRRFWMANLRSYFVSLKPYEDAKYYINKLKEEGHEICFVTARGTDRIEKEIVDPEEVEILTKHWLLKHDIKYDKVIFNGNKLDACLEEEIDLMIDDYKKNVLQVSSKLPVIMPTYKHNAMISGNNIYRAKSWQEIYEEVKLLSQK